MVKPRHVITVAAVLHLLAGAGASTAATKKYARATFLDYPDGTQNANIRSFLWHHWALRDLAIATVKWRTIEGDTGTSTYTTAPDESGVWRIKIHLEGSQRRMGPAEPPRHRSEHSDAYIVERARMPQTFEERMSPRVPIHGNAALPPKKYLLLLKDNAGKLVEEL